MRTGFLKYFLVAAFAALSLSASAQSRETRIALIIANGAYQNVAALENPRRDALLVQRALNQAGFTTVVRLDLSKSQMESELRSFSRSASRADIALLYYAGHGIQVENDNWLVPVDARLEVPTDVRTEAIRGEDLLAFMRDVRKLRVIVLDACRDNPFAPAWLARGFASTRTLGVARGLAPIEGLPGGTVLAFAAGPQQRAFDRPAAGGQNSPFATAFAQRIVEPNVELASVWRRIRADVRRLAPPQEPWVNETREEDFFFIVRPTPTSSTAIPEPSTNVAGSNGNRPANSTQGGRTSILGGSGNDTLTGDAGNNCCMWGNDGDDVLSGGAGDDMLYGNNGDDRLYGGPGADILRGGPGNDRYWGNDGGANGQRDESKDSFVMANETRGVTKASMMFGRDIIYDFDVAHDTVHFEGMYAFLNTWSAINGSIFETGGNSVIELGASSVTLVGVRKNQLSMRNFSVSLLKD